MKPSVLANESHRTLWTYGPADVKSFGNAEDGVIEMATKTRDGGLSEAGCYFGSATHPDYPVFGISTATGCPMQCAFCDLGSQPAGRNLESAEMSEQLLAILRESATRGVNVDQGLKVNFAKTGEPLFNPNLAETIHRMTREIHGIRFKVSTVFPAASSARRNLETLAEAAAQCPTTIQVQVSLISTSEDYRQKIAGRVASFQTIAGLAALWRGKHPKRSQFNLSMILSAETPCEPGPLLEHFDPRHFRIRLRDCVQTQAAQTAGLGVIDDLQLQSVRSEFEKAGYTVSLAGRPTQTEVAHALAANATRNAVRLGAE